MTDGQYQTYWASSSGSYAYVEIEKKRRNPSAACMCSFMNIFRGAGKVQTTDDAGASRTVAVSGGSFLNEYIALDAGTEDCAYPSEGR